MNARPKEGSAIRLGPAWGQELRSKEAQMVVPISPGALLSDRCLLYRYRPRHAVGYNVLAI